MVYKFRFKNLFLQKGRISKKKRITVKRHGRLSGIPKELHEPDKKKVVKEHVGLAFEVSKDINGFIPKKRRTVKERGLPTKPKDLYELYNGYPSQIPRKLYDNVVKGLGLVSDIPEALYMVVNKGVAIRKYLEMNEGNEILNLRLHYTEEAIDSYSSYFKYTKQLPRDWK